MTNVLKVFFVLLFPISLCSQVLEFDLLEMNYDQKTYRKVYRKANKFLDNPEYDYSYVPRYYLALTQLQLAQNNNWRRRNKTAIEEAKETLLFLNTVKEGKAVLVAHEYEILGLYNDMMQWKHKLKQEGETTLHDQIEKLIADVFKDKIATSLKPEKKEIQEVVPTLEEEEWQNAKEKTENVLSGTVREEILAFSTTLLGIPYKYAGTTPQGFDCSGFTSYVMENSAGLSLDYNSAAQYMSAKKIGRKDVQPGDLVFFSRSGRIFHVGIVFSTNNDSVQMIHSSTSVGISIVDIYQSDYWRTKIKGFGTYL